MVSLYYIASNISICDSTKKQLYICALSYIASSIYSEVAQPGLCILYIASKYLLCYPKKGVLFLPKIIETGG